MQKSFSDLGFSDVVLEAIKSKGFEEPTYIQSQAIPLLIQSQQDIIAQAQTGTGKTAAFGLVFTEKLIPKKAKQPQAIVLAPTRELALQISEELHSLSGSKKLSIVPVYGGQSWGLQRKHLRDGVDIVVGTPGRIMDHLDRGTLDLSKIEYFVLDEADEMLNMGFIEDIEKILTFVNEKRQVLLFSATMPTPIARLAQKYMKNPITIKTEKDQIANNSVDQIYFEVFERDKFDALCRIIDMEEEFYGIIFCRTKNDADDVTKKLNDRGYKAEGFHGDISQDRREQILMNFRKRRTEVLVATDVAARGIDVQDLTHVINYSLPQNSEYYVHRIGRTGRAGKSGKAITLITPSEYRKMRFFEHRSKAAIHKKLLPDAQAMVELKKKKILKNIESILEEGESLKSYEELAQEMFGDKDSQKVLAGLLKYVYAQQLETSFYKEITETHPSGEKRGRSNIHNGKEKPQRLSQPEMVGTTRLFLTTGKQDGATVPKILRMIEKDFQVPGKFISDIDIMDSFSFITVPFRDAEIILEEFEKLRRKKKPSVRIEKVSQAKKTKKRKNIKGKKRRS